jgi:hypothetical protein
MSEIFVPIDMFPDYLVGDLGTIKSLHTNRPLRPAPNQQDILFVSLRRQGKPYGRSVAKLVAEHFLEPHPESHFNTVTHRDADRWNCQANNLMWRPRWFAVKYHREMDLHSSRWTDSIGNWDTTPIVSDEDELAFENLWDFCHFYGVLPTTAIQSIKEETPIWPADVTARLADN